MYGKSNTLYLFTLLYGNIAEKSMDRTLRILFTIWTYSFSLTKTDRNTLLEIKQRAILGEFWINNDFDTYL